MVPVQKMRCWCILPRWVRLRLRAALWRQWKTPRRRRAALLELGLRPRLASNTVGSGKGPWHLVLGCKSSRYLQSPFPKDHAIVRLARKWFVRRVFRAADREGAVQ